MSVEYSTPDICDNFPDAVSVAHPGLKAFGGNSRAAGEILVVNIDEDNSPIWQLVETAGNNRIMVINNNAKYCAVFGDRMAGLAVDNSWQGIVINGYARDTGIISKMDLGLWALGSCPRKCPGQTLVENNDMAEFLGLSFKSGDFVYIDDDGILLSSEELDVRF